MPGYSVGHELCEALARVSGGWVNLHPETTAGLAHQIAGGYLAEKNMTLLTGYLSAAVIEEVFQELEGKKVLHYFAREGSSPGLVRAIASSIFELRNAGVTSDSLSADSFVSPEKGQDMLVLLKEYELYLEQHNYIDTPGLLALTLQLLSSTKPAADDVIYLLPSFLHLYPLELQLIKSIADGCLHTLNTDPVYGPARPGAESSEFNETCELAPGTDVERLPWLYQVELSPPPLGAVAASGGS
ncbi:MAG: hypothetical protein K6U74_04755 [Firmicutes bacterium]|nr:hypothetical protein [Bacillota bacterium]